MFEIEFIEDEDALSKLPHHVRIKNPGFEGITILNLDLGKIDSVWKLNPYSYSGIGGSDRKGERIKRIHERIGRTKKEYMPIIYLGDPDPKTIMFADGRHRTSYLYEAGYRSAPFIVPKYQAQVIQKNFGYSK